MSGIGGRPLTVLHPALLSTVLAVRGVIVARRSRCGRYITYQAAENGDQEMQKECRNGRARIVADHEDVENARAVGLSPAQLRDKIVSSGLLDGL